MHLHDLMGWDGPMTQRQFLAWIQWLNKERGVPDRSDHYAMQIAYWSARAAGASPEWTKKQNDMIIPFGEQAEPVKRMSVEEATRIAKARNRARFGSPIKETPAVDGNRT